MFAPECPITVCPTPARPTRSPRSPFCWTTARVPSLSTCRMVVAIRNSTVRTANISSDNGGTRPAPCPRAPPPPGRRHRRNCTITIPTSIHHRARFTGRPQLVHLISSNTGSSILYIPLCLICTEPVPGEDHVINMSVSNPCLPAVAKGRASRDCPPMLTRTTWKRMRYQRMCIIRLLFRFHQRHLPGLPSSG